MYSNKSLIPSFPRENNLNSYLYLKRLSLQSTMLLQLLGQTRFHALFTRLREQDVTLQHLITQYIVSKFCIFYFLFNPASGEPGERETAKNDGPLQISG